VAVAVIQSTYGVAAAAIDADAGPSQDPSARLEITEE
jgi:hypothetical protein